MGAIFDLLPFLKGWRYSPVDIDVAKTVSAGKELEVHIVPFPGWVLWSFGSVNNPLAEVIIKYEYLGIVHEADLRPYALNILGLTVPSPVGFWVSRYDDINKIYTTVFAPQIPQSFSTKCTILLRAPKTADVTLLNYGSLCIEISNKTDFLESLKEVLGAELVEALLRREIPLAIPRVMG